MDSATLWFLIGFVLVLLEFVVPGVILVFFGLGAWVVCVALKIGWVDDLASQMLVFWLSSLVLLFSLRRVCQSWFKGFSSSRDTSVNLDEFKGQEVLVIDPVPSGGRGKVEFKGVQWAARSEADLCAGERGVIEEVDGLCLVIQKR